MFKAARTSIIINSQTAQNGIVKFYNSVFKAFFPQEIYKIWCVCVFRFFSFVLFLPFSKYTWFWFVFAFHLIIVLFYCVHFLSAQKWLSINLSPSDCCLILFFLFFFYFVGLNNILSISFLWLFCCITSINEYTYTQYNTPQTAIVSTVFFLIRCLSSILSTVYFQFNFHFLCFT